MHTTRFGRRLALLAAAAAAALSLAACDPLAIVAAAPSSHPSATAAASAIDSRASAEANSQGGQAIESAAQQLAAACEPVLGKQGYQAMVPGQPAAGKAREAFVACEKIPEAQLPLLGVCIVRAWHAAPPAGPAGTPAENSRQAFLATAVGKCVQGARKAADQ